MDGHVANLPGGFGYNTKSSVSWNTVANALKKEEKAQKKAEVEPDTEGVKLAEHLVADVEATPLLTSVKHPKQKQVKIAPKQKPVATVRAPVATTPVATTAVAVATTPVATTPVATKQRAPEATKRRSSVSTAQLKPKVHLALEKAAVAKKVAHLQRVTKRKELKYKKAMKVVEKLQPAGDKA